MSPLPPLRISFRLIATLSVALCLVAASRALAQEIPVLEGPITDLADTGESFRDSERALDDLLEDENVQLFVLIIDTTGRTSIPDYTDDVVSQNNLGGNDALLVIALDDRQYQLALGDLLLDEVTENEQDRLLADYLEPGLRDDDLDRAISTLAGGLKEANAGNLGDPPRNQGGTSQQSGGDDSGGGGISLWWVLAFLLALGLVIFIVVAIRKVATKNAPPTKPGRQPQAPQRKSDAELEAEASRLLLQTDDAVREARQDAGFAEAQFGAEEGRARNAELERAEAELKAAFVAHQQLDDGIPEPPDERRRLFETIIERCNAALAIIEQQAERTRSLEELARRAPDVLAALPAAIHAQESRLPALDAVLDQLDRMAPAVFEPVEGNIEEASKQLAFATAAVEAGQQALSRHESAAAAVAALRAQEEVEKAKTLLDAIEHQQKAVEEARSGYDAARLAALKDLESARAAIASGKLPGFESRVAELQSAIDNATRLASAEKPDFIAAQKEAARADTLGDEVLKGVRDAEEQRARQRATLDANLKAATIALRRAEDYVESRRDGVGRESRTRLAEASRKLEEARGLITVNPDEANKLAIAAQRLADEAYDRARGDFDRWDRDRTPPRGYERRTDYGGWDRPRSRSGGADIGSIGGAVLGGIIGGMLSGGGSRGGGGFGGSKWGSAARIGGRMAGGGFGKGRSRGGRW